MGGQLQSYIGVSHGKLVICRSIYTHLGTLVPLEFSGGHAYMMSAVTRLLLEMLVFPGDQLSSVVKTW